MAHSYSSAINAGLERTIGVRDPLLQVFMGLFTDYLKLLPLTAPQTGIFRHYMLELAQVNTSFIDLQLAEIHQRPELRHWYLDTLVQLATFVDSFGDSIDNAYLNSLPQLKDERPYPNPVSAQRVKKLINDIRWVLHEPGVQISDDFKWFEQTI